MIKYCEYCKKHPISSDLQGYTNSWSDNTHTCPVCKHDLTDIDFPEEDFKIIKQISYDPQFIESMIELRKKDIIEYNLKLSQFRNQIAQQNRVVKDNVPKCPVCGSTNINKITLTNRIIKTSLFGAIGAVDDAGKTYKCGNCGSKF